MHTTILFPILAVRIAVFASCFSDPPVLKTPAVLFHNQNRITELSHDAKNLLDHVTYWMGGTSFFGFLANAAAGDIMPSAIAAITPYIVFLTSLGTLALLIYNFSIKVLDRRSLKQRSKEIHDIVNKSSGREKK